MLLIHRTRSILAPDIFVFGIRQRRNPEAEAGGGRRFRPTVTAPGDVRLGDRLNAPLHLTSTENDARSPVENEPPTTRPLTRKTITKSKPKRREGLRGRLATDSSVSGWRVGEDFFHEPLVRFTAACWSAWSPSREACLARKALSTNKQGVSKAPNLMLTQGSAP